MHERQQPEELELTRNPPASEMMSRKDRVEATALQRLCASTPLEIAAFSLRTTILRRPPRRPRRQERA